MKKQRAEGPFWKTETRLCCGNVGVCFWNNSFYLTDYLNEHLSDWLKSPAGKRWMKQEKISPAKSR